MIAKTFGTTSLALAWTAMRGYRVGERVTAVVDVPEHGVRKGRRGIVRRASRLDTSRAGFAISARNVVGVEFGEGGPVEVAESQIVKGWADA